MVGHMFFLCYVLTFCEDVVFLFFINSIWCWVLIQEVLLNMEVMLHNLGGTIRKYTSAELKLHIIHLHLIVLMTQKWYM